MRLKRHSRTLAQAACLIRAERGSRRLPGLVVAEHLGLPHASLLSIGSGSFDWTDLAAEPLNELRAEYGLPHDPALAMLGRYLVLPPFPPS